MFLLLLLLVLLGLGVIAVCKCGAVGGVGDGASSVVAAWAKHFFRSN